jgi:hypothetical protein
MCGKKAGQHAGSGFKGNNSAFAMPQPRQRYSEVKMSQGQEMLKSHGQQRLLSGFFIAPLAQAN